jgi:hypothetical protein
MQRRITGCSAASRARALAESTKVHAWDKARKVVEQHAI